jgi:hypothetical protein
LGVGHQRTRDFLIHEAGSHASIIRGRYKLVMNRGGKSVKTKKGKKGNKGGGSSSAGLALYDLVADHAEANNIADANPDLVKELQTLLIGERVTEPPWFAQTYHLWTGASGADVADADSWSDYTYANAGETYLSDAGAPRVSWIALMKNTSTQPCHARVTTDVAFLGLEVRGNAKASAAQQLTVSSGATLTGRNEVRVSSQGVVTLEKGTISSLRWVDVLPGGMVQGAGCIDATLYNAGTIAPKGALNVKGDYHEQAGAKLNVTLHETAPTQLTVSGEAVLNGTLTITVDKGFRPTAGSTIKLLTAKHIKGEFVNADSRVAAGGVQFKISYSDKAVTLTVQ